MGEKPENSKDGQDEVKEKKRLDLSVPQVAGSAVAAVVAAKLASSFGVYGTILGAGVVSALATCGGTVFQHFFKRTGEQIRDAAVQTKPKGRQVPVTAEGRPVPRTFRSDASMDATQVMTSKKAVATGVPQPAAGVLPTTTTWGRPSGADDDAWPADEDGTRILDTGAVADLLPDDPESDPERTRLLGTADPERTQLLAASPVDEATRLLRTADAGPYDPSGPLSPAEPELAGTGDEFTEGTVHRSRVKSWKRPLIAAALVFGVTMGGITTYELVSGHSFNGDSGSTTFRDAFTGHGKSSGDDTPAPGTSTRPSDGSSTGTEDSTRQQDGGAAQDGPADPSPSGSTGKGSGTDPDSGAGTGTGSGDDSGTDPGTGSDDEGASTSPTPTPTPSQSAGSGTGDEGSATGAAEGAAGAGGQPAAQ
ncbi:hypothetical protein ACFW9D_04650 [Streptomyces sp. NPDC059524]|uniref:hypothetical protein n=1 Tax=Streptomyces sp. NPDC059524 TaxID=3346856 RepID=UPI00368ABA7F